MQQIQKQFILLSINLMKILLLSFLYQDINSQRFGYYHIILKKYLVFLYLFVVLCFFFLIFMTFISDLIKI